MSVIIRLQNLPWSANAMDIRNFFRGLSIPEGGVHIVGGEQGDAFIAFSTDEDARQAMLNNGGRLKEVQVKLLLSSRSEMLKVIETARQAVTFMQMSSQPALPAQPVVTQPSPIPQSITGLLAQNLKQLQVPALPLNNVLAANAVKSNDASLQQGQEQLKDASKNNKDSKFDRRRSRSISRDRHKKDRNSRDNKKDKRERTRSRDRSRDRDRRRRDRSRSRDRRDRKRDRNIHSRDRDRSKERSERYKKGDASKDPKVPFGVKPPNNRPNGPNAEPKTRFGGWATSAEISGQTQALAPNVMNPYLNQNQNNRPAGWDAEMPQQMAAANPVMGVMPNPNINAMMNMNNSVPPNAIPPQDSDNRNKEMGDRRNPNSFQSNDKYFNDSYGSRRNHGGEGRFNRGHSRFSRPYNNRSDRPFRTTNFKVVENSCLKVSNLSDRTLYKDIRRFFSGLFIPSSGLKLINDQYGKYTGTAFVRFSSPQDKFEGLKRSGRILNGNNTVIEHLDDVEYDNASDLYLPNRRDSPEKEEEMDTSNDLIIVENPNEVNEGFNVLYLEDLPPFVKEQDIMKMFSDYSLLSILLYNSKDMRKQYVAYVQFARANDAKTALNDKSKHMIGHINIKVSPCSDATYEQAKIDNAEIVEDDNEMDNDGPEDSDMRLNETPSQDANVPRDPRQRKFDSKPTDNLQLNNVQHFQNPMISQPPGMQPDMFAWRPNAPVMPTPNPAGMMPVGERMPYGGPAPNNSFNGPPQRHRFHPEPILDCIFIKGLPLSATDKDVLNLFSDLNVTPTRIHLMLTLQGEPSGDCFCEFSDAGEASVALNKNGAMVGINRVSVELVPKSVVNDALGVPNHGNNFDGNNFDVGGGMGRGFRGGRGGPPRGRGRGRGRGDFHGGRGGRGGYGGGPPIIHPEPTESFGSPGTVVAMENVPYRATINEITDFFSDFNVTQQDIIRRFNEHGQPTGDARVNLHTTFDAQKAVNMLNMAMLRDRTVTLSILQSN